jgi:hypothetical protein
MNKPKIILLSAKAQHGKDEFIKIAIPYMNKIYPNLKVKRLAYGDFVKYVCHQYFDCSFVRDEYNRTMWQTVGTEIGRANNTDIWVNIAIELAKGIFSDYDYLLIPDFRFKNEHTKWKQNGFKTSTIRIKRNDFDNGLTDIQKNHASEIALDDYRFNYFIYNNGDLDTYKRAVEIFIDDFIHKDNQ